MTPNLWTVQGGLRLLRERGGTPEVPRIEVLVDHNGHHALDCWRPKSPQVHQTVAADHADGDCDCIWSRTLEADTEIVAAAASWHARNDLDDLAGQALVGRLFSLDRHQAILQRHVQPQGTATRQIVSETLERLEAETTDIRSSLTHDGTLLTPLVGSLEGLAGMLGVSEAKATGIGQRLREASGWLSFQVQIQTRQEHGPYDHTAVLDAVTRLARELAQGPDTLLLSDPDGDYRHFGRLFTPAWHHTALRVGVAPEEAAALLVRTIPQRYATLDQLPQDPDRWLDTIVSLRAGGGHFASRLDTAVDAARSLV